MNVYKYIEIKQPIGVFYMCCIPASVLLNIVEARTRKDSEDGVQRDKIKSRIDGISNYCSDSDAIFPTPIVISINQKAKVILDEEKKTIAIPTDEIIGDVIDGQHRLWGINASTYAKEFELPVVFMFNLTVEEKAYIFSTINSNQKKVDASLLYDLFDVSTKRSPNKTVHEIARTMNYSEESPFYNRLKMLGKKEPTQDNATLSQGTFAKSLLMLITRDPEGDARAIKRGDKLILDERLPFRQFFIDDKDDVIARIISNCFNALKEVFEEEWKNPQKNILWKTTGFRGVIYALPTMMNKGLREQNLTKAYFVKCFTVFKKYLEDKGLTVTSEDFTGGGEQNQKLFAKHLADSIKSSNIDEYNENLMKFRDIDEFIESIDADKYEIFDLVYALDKGDTPHDTLEVSKSNDSIEITQTYTDSSLNIPLSQSKELVRHIKERYMEGMDADSWLGYMEAVEKDD